MEDRENSKHDYLPLFYFFITGGASNVSWNALLNSFDYFATKYPQYHVSFIFPIAIYVAQFLSSLVMTQISSKLPYSLRIICSLIIVTIIILFSPFEALIFSDTTFGIAFIMALLFILGFCNNVCFSSVAGLASQLPGIYTTCIFIGTAFIGFFMSILREIASLAFTSTNSSDIFSVGFFFGIAALLIIIAIIMQPIFSRSPFYRTRFVQPLKVGLGDVEGAILVRHSIRPLERNFRTSVLVFKEVWFPVLLLTITYAQTYTVFPGVMEEKETPTISNQVKIVSMALSFTVSSMIGKLLGKFRRYYSLLSAGWMVIFRFVLIVFFVIQAATDEIAVFNTLWFGYLNIILFALSYGFITIAVCIISPEHVTGEKKEIAGFLSIFAINVGTMIGTFIALPFSGLEAHHPLYSSTSILK